MCRYRKLFFRIVLFTIIQLTGHILFTCCFTWGLKHGQPGGTGMFIVSPGSVVDPASIELAYEDGYLRKASLSIANIAPDGMIYSDSYSKFYFVEDKERDEVYVSTDGFYYDLIPRNEKDNVTAKAYRWMVAWLRPQEKL